MARPKRNFINKKHLPHFDSASSPSAQALFDGRFEWLDGRIFSVGTPLPISSNMLHGILIPSISQYGMFILFWERWNCDTWQSRQVFATVAHGPA
ncbi:hypothetical protein NKJ40_30340 [Mesorhizobium sp. M0119]|uniref:hypothetical protein n=1 Tax=unclassified Mesorhizobium TaxID=325217 RepID=UPI003335DB54